MEGFKPGRLKIIPMSADDIDEVAAITAISFSVPWSLGQFSREYSNPLSHTFIAKYPMDDGDETTVGFICFWLVAGEAHILKIAVHPDFRKLGIGRSLLIHALYYSLDRRVSRFLLEVREGNSEAIKFYSSFGFRENGRRKRYYSDTGEDAVLMDLEASDIPHHY